MMMILLLCLTQLGFSSSFEVNYFGDIDSPIPKLTVIKSNEYRASLDFETKKGFELTILIQEIQYNEIMGNIISFSNSLPLSSNYFICRTASKTCYFLNFEKMLKLLDLVISIIENQEAISYLIDYMRRIEILSTYTSK
jgi:hypothetical protein